MRALKSSSSFDRLTLLLILAIAALTRLTSPGIVEFLHDEAMLSLLALDFVDGGAIPTTGIPSSVGIPNPPISVYIMALPYAITNNPLVATMFIAVLNVIGVGLLWSLARRSIGRMAALLAAMIYALNPWAILYSRKIWAQNFHTPFVLLGLMLGLYGFVEGKRWAQVLTLPVLILAFQIHFAAWALLPLYAWFLWVGRKHIRRKAFATSIVLAALALLPYAVGVYETAQENPDLFTDEFKATGEDGLSLNADGLTFMTRLATGREVETWSAPQQQAELREAVGIGTTIWYSLIVLIVIGAATLIRQHHRLATLIMLWALLPLIIFTPTWTEVFPHYFIASIPATALLAGVGAAWILRQVRDHRAGQVIILGGLGVVLITQALWWQGFLDYVDTTETPGGFGTPLHYLLDVRDTLMEQDDVLIVSDGFDILLDQEPAIWSVMLHDEASCIRTIADDGVAIFPAHPFAAAIAPNAPNDAVDNLYVEAGAQAFPIRPGADEYTISIFDSSPEWHGPLLTPIEPVQFGNGVQLTGYHLTDDRMYLEWHLPGRGDADYHYFGHFLDANGERMGQRDNILWPGRFWCAGDRLITWADIDRPADIATLRVGLYVIEREQFINSPVIDDAGNPVNVWVDIPLDDN